MLEEGKGWKSSFHPPLAPPQLKLLQPVALGAQARDGAGMRHWGWDPGSGRCGVRLLPSRGVRGGQAGRESSMGWQGPGTTRGGSPHAPPSAGVLQHRSPAALPPRVPHPPLDLLLLSSLIPRRDLKG